jgi:hypothetical protein
MVFEEVRSLHVIVLDLKRCLADSCKLILLFAFKLCRMNFLRHLLLFGVKETNSRFVIYAAKFKLAKMEISEFFQVILPKGLLLRKMG